MLRAFLIAVFSAVLCFPCYASSVASSSDALWPGYDIPGLPKDSKYSSYALIENDISFSYYNKDYAEYVLFAFYSPPAVTRGGFGFQDGVLHFTGHLGVTYDAYMYSISSGQWIKLGGEYGLLNIYDLERDKLIMSTSTIFYKDKLKPFYYYFPVTVTFERQLMLSDLVQLIYRVVISLLAVIILIIAVRVALKLICRVMYTFIRKGVL